MTLCLPTSNISPKEKLIILLGISWSEDNEFDSEKEKIEFLNNIGRENFYQKLFY